MSERDGNCWCRQCYWDNCGQWQPSQSTRGKNCRQVQEAPLPSIAYVQSCGWAQPSLEDAQTHPMGCSWIWALQILPNKSGCGVGVLRDFFSRIHSVEMFCCLMLCFVLWHVAGWLDPNCSISLPENAPSPPLKLEVAREVLRWYVCFLPWKLTAVSINEVALAISAVVLYCYKWCRIFQCYLLQDLLPSLELSQRQ